MGIGQNLKGLYLSMEDKYYALLDRIGDHAPVYAVVDPIDRVFPSFALLLILIAAGIAVLLSGGISIPVLQGDVTLQALVEDRAGNKLPGVPVQWEFDGSVREAVTNDEGTAQFSVPANASGLLRIDLPGYQKIEEPIQTAGRDLARKLTLLPAELPQTRIIQFADSAGRAISGKTISVRLACSNSSVALSRSVFETDSAGKIEVEAPAGCGNFAGTVLGPGEFQSQSFTISTPHQVIKLEPVSVPLGRLKVRVAGESNQLLSGVNGSVTLFGNLGEERTLPLQNGFAQFRDLTVGEYYVSAEDTDGLYAAKTSEHFNVRANEQTEITVNLNRDVQQRLSITVKNSDTGAAIARARVVLVHPVTNAESFVKETNNSGKADFSLFEPEDWMVQASAENFVSVSRTVLRTATSLTLELEPISEANSGIVNVKVVDEDGKPVENARVRLRFEETQVFAPYPPYASDLNGMARWTGVRDGERLFAYAEKFPASGASPPVTIARLEPNELTVIMEVGDTAVSVSALTEDNEPIPDSTAEFFDSTGESLGEIPLSDGRGSVSLKSDKRIFVIVKNPEFFSYQSETFQLFKDNEIRIDAHLPSRLVSGGPRVALLGVFDESGNEVEQMEAGNNYLVRLQLKIPEDSHYSEAGIHFRVGSQSLTENDQIVIKSVNVANALVVRGTTYNPSKGSVVDLNPANLTTGDAKWTNIVFDDPVPQVYNVSIDVRVKSTAVLNAPIPMFYRAFALSSGSQMARDPQDNELGDALQTTEIQALYANAYAVTRFFEGTGSECDDFFCYSNIRFFDNTEGLYRVAPFELANNQDYNFSFVITNTSPANLTGAVLHISFLSDGVETSDYSVLKYRVQNASAQVFSAENLAAPRFEISTGSFVVNEDISGNILFRPTKVIPGSIRLQTVFNGEIVSTREIFFETISEKKILIALEPDPIPALIEVPAVVTLTEEGNLEPVLDARVTLSRETRDRVKNGEQKPSNALGIAEFVIPASSPGTKIIVEADKPNYSAEPLVRIVDENVLVFDPDSLSLALKTPTEPEAQATVSISNVTQTNIRIARLQLVGQFAGLLDKTKIDGYLGTLVGTTIDAESTEEVVLVKAFLAPNARLFQNQSIKASLAVEAVDETLGSRWVFSIPVTISISIDGLPDNENCLSVDEPIWQATSQESNLQHAFTLTNNCQIEGNALALSNLQATINWNSNAVGNVELTLTDAENPNNSITQVLRADNWVSLFDIMPENGTYFGILHFVPKTGKTGEEAVFNVEFAAETPTDAGVKKLGTQEPIQASILLTNLRLCVKYTTSGGETRNIAEFPNRATDPSNTGTPESETQNPDETPPANASSARTNTETQLNLAGSESQGNSNANSRVIRSLTPVANAQFVSTANSNFNANFASNENADFASNENSNSAYSSASLQSETSASQDEEFTQLEIGTGDDGSLTIDISECGELDVDFVLCKGDEKCRGGTEDGGVIVKPLQFSLSPENPSREVKVSRDQVPGIYGLEVWARTKGRNFNRIATVDVLLDPREDDGDFFTLSKYEFFIKGFGAIDTAMLRNNNYVTTTTVDAPASMWGNREEPAADGAFGSMLPLMGAALLPQMIQPLLGGLQGAYDGAKNLTNAKDTALKDAKDAAANAQNKVKTLKDDFAKELNSGLIKKLDDSLATDLKKTIEESRKECAKLAENSPLITCLDRVSSDSASTEKAVCRTLTQKIQAAHGKCVDAMDAADKLVKDKWGEVKPGFERAGEKLKGSLGSSMSASDTAAGIKPFGNTANVSANAGSAANTLNTGTCADIGKALGSSASDGLAGAGSQLGRSLTGLDDLKKSFSDFKDKDFKDIFEGVDAAGCTTCSAYLPPIQKALSDKMGKKLTDTIGKIGSTKDGLAAKYDPTNGEAFKAAKTGLENAKTKCSAGVEAMNDKANATEVASNHARGPDSAANSAALTNVLSQAAMMGIMAGALGNSFGANPTEDSLDERVQQVQQVFAINLPSDNTGIGLDREGVTAAFDEESVKAFGKTDLTAQTIGVKFENIGLEEDTPSFALATFNATEHRFDPVTKIPFGADIFTQLDSWGLGSFFGKRQEYQQKFHLKFVSKDTLLELPPIAGDQFSCTQGAMVGQTGVEALPRVKLAWNWTDIGIDACDAKNPDYIYCDATQFSIMMTKRLHALSVFLEENQGIPCPTNWLQEQVQAELDPFNQYLIELDFEAFNSEDFVSSCWLPKTTDLFDNKSALEYYVDDAPAVNWTPEVPDAQALHDLLFFDAYLIQDGYSSDFRQDFSRYYSNVSLLDTPGYFFTDAEGKNFNSFFETESINFQQKFSDVTQLPTSGLYRVETIVDFGDDEWEFFSGSTPNAAIAVDLLALRQSPLNSVFYYLPFDGEVGIEGATLERQGYGIGYDVIGNDTVGISRSESVTTRVDAGSNPVQLVHVTRNASFEELNAFASQRGFILDISNDALNEKSIRFSPSLATPVLLKVSQDATTEPFGAFYTIRNADIPQNLGGSAAFWSGAGACLDFSGDLVAEVWDFRPDRHAESTDRLPNWEFAYGVDWPLAEQSGDVYLKTVFFAPSSGEYALNAASENLEFATPDSAFASAVNLEGISSMPFNRKGLSASDRLTAIEDVFDLVEQGTVCVTNTGVKTSFWWNPKTLFEQAGGSESISEIESALESGRTCR